MISSTYAKFMCLINYFSKIHDIPLRVWVLKYNSTDILVTKVDFKNITNFYRDTEWQCSGLNTSNCLGMKFVRQEKSFSLVVPLIWKHFDFYLFPLQRNTILYQYSQFDQYWAIFTWSKVQGLRRLMFLRPIRKHWRYPTP